MSFGKAQKQNRNEFKKKLKEQTRIVNIFKGINDDEVYTFGDKPDIKGSDLKQIFKEKYTWLK